MTQQPTLGDEVVVHFLDSEYGSMPTDAQGALGIDTATGRMLVGERSIIPADVWTIHLGECDHRDQRSPAARDNFHRKYGYYPEAAR